ncbi:MAG TPA: hypothetical protein VHZ55_14335 [Bryobacteraceae bacterium]|nr:hypothetical protein [Bryobacteraceae bacterium]
MPSHAPYSKKFRYLLLQRADESRSRLSASEVTRETMLRSYSEYRALLTEIELEELPLPTAIEQ